jgi:hypothetical protein
VAADQEIPQVSVRPQFEKVVGSIVRSPWRIAAAVILMGAATFLSEYTVHLWVTRPGVFASFQAFADALVLSVLAALFTLLVLTTAREQHRRMREDIRRIAELNHQVRNALQVIVYGEFSSDSAEHRPAVLEGVEKIETALRELFPLVGERTDDRPWEAHNRARLPGRHLQQEEHRFPERRSG